MSEDRNVNSVPAGHRKKLSFTTSLPPSSPATVEFFVDPGDVAPTSGVVGYECRRSVRVNMDGHGDGNLHEGKYAVVASGTLVTSAEMSSAKADGRTSYREVTVIGGIDEVVVTNNTNVTTGVVRVRITERATPVKEFKP
jgi:hypothetical protein